MVTQPVKGGGHDLYDCLLSTTRLSAALFSSTRIFGCCIYSLERRGTTKTQQQPFLNKTEYAQEKSEGKITMPNAANDFPLVEHHQGEKAMTILLIFTLFIFRLLV